MSPTQLRLPPPLLTAGTLAFLLPLLALVLTIDTSATVARFDSILVGHAVAVDLGPVTDAARAMTSLADSDVVPIVAIAGVGVLALLRHWRGVLTLAISLAATHLTVSLIKGFVARPRPEEEGLLTHATNFSFPSGHAATSVAVYAAVALIAAGSLRHWPVAMRIGVVAFGALIALLVGGSRVLLGVHYPSDVLAGWTLGAAIALGAWWLTKHVDRIRLRPAVE